MKGKHERIEYFDILRLIATIAVIIIHISSQSQFYVKNLHTTSWQTLNFWNAISRFSVPLFVMISGALFLNLKFKVDFKKICSKNIYRIVCAFIIWDIIYALFAYFIEGNSKMEVLGILIKGYSHLWFLPMIVCLYLLIPFLRKITANNNLMSYFLILALIFSLLLPTFFGVYGDLSIHKKMPIFVQTIMNSLYKFSINTHFNFTLGFVTYFVAGDYFNRNTLLRVWRYIIYALSIFSFVLTFIGTNFLSLRYNTQILPFYDYMSINVALETLGLFIFIKSIMNNHSLNKMTIKLSELSFGIYLIHLMIVHILINNVKMFTLIPNYMIAVPVIAIMSFLLSAIIVWGISYIPWAKNHIM